MKQPSQTQPAILTEPLQPLYNPCIILIYPLMQIPVLLRQWIDCTLPGTGQSICSNASWHKLVRQTELMSSLPTSQVEPRSGLAFPAPKSAAPVAKSFAAARLQAASAVFSLLLQNMTDTSPALDPARKHGRQQTSSSMERGPVPANSLQPNVISHLDWSRSVATTYFALSKHHAFGFGRPKFQMTL